LGLSPASSNKDEVVVPITTHYRPQSTTNYISLDKGIKTAAVELNLKCFGS